MKIMSSQTLGNQDEGNYTNEEKKIIYFCHFHVSRHSDSLVLELFLRGRKRLDDRNRDSPKKSLYSKIT
jgi:hypothetical protein